MQLWVRPQLLSHHDSHLVHFAPCRNQYWIWRIAPCHQFGFYPLVSLVILACCTSIFYDQKYFVRIDRQPVDTIVWRYVLASAGEDILCLTDLCHCLSRSHSLAQWRSFTFAAQLIQNLYFPCIVHSVGFLLYRLDWCYFIFLQYSFISCTII